MKRKRMSYKLLNIFLCTTIINTSLNNNYKCYINIDIPTKMYVVFIITGNKKKIKYLHTQ